MSIYHSQFKVLIVKHASQYFDSIFNFQNNVFIEKRKAWYYSDAQFVMDFVVDVNFHKSHIYKINMFSLKRGREMWRKGKVIQR